MMGMSFLLSDFIYTLQKEIPNGNLNLSTRPLRLLFQSTTTVCSQRSLGYISRTSFLMDGMKSNRLRAGWFTYRQTGLDLVSPIDNQ